MSNLNCIAYFKKFLREEDGLTTVEYAIAGGLVSAAVVTGFDTLGDNVSTVINHLATAVAGVDTAN